jgi:hypothetical protein
VRWGLSKHTFRLKLYVISGLFEKEKEKWKVLLRNCISLEALVSKKSWQHHNLQPLVKIKELPWLKAFAKPK